MQLSERHFLPQLTIGSFPSLWFHNYATIFLHTSFYFVHVSFFVSPIVVLFHRTFFLQIVCVRLQKQHVIFTWCFAHLGAVKKLLFFSQIVLFSSQVVLFFHRSFYFFSQIVLFFSQIVVFHISCIFFTDRYFFFANNSYFFTARLLS
jgi:hypothetical protein